MSLEMSERELFDSAITISKHSMPIHLIVVLGSGGIGTWFLVNFSRNILALLNTDKEKVLFNSIIDIEVVEEKGRKQIKRNMFILGAVFDDDVFEFHNFNRLPLNATSFGRKKVNVAVEKIEEVPKVIASQIDINNVMSVVPIPQKSDPQSLRANIERFLRANPRNRVTLINTTDSPRFHCLLVKELISDEAIKGNMNILFVDIHYDGMLVSEGYFRPIEEAKVLLPWSGTCEGVPGYTQASSHPAPPYYISESAFQRILQAWRMPDKRIKWIENKELDALIL